MNQPTPRPLSRGRRILEVLLVSLAGGLLLWTGSRWEEAGPLVGAAWVILMTPAVVERWRSPLLGFLPGMLGAVVVSHQPLRQFAWFVPYTLMPVLTYHFALQALLARWLWRVSRWPAVIVLPLCVGAGEWSRAWLGLGHFNMFQSGAFLFGYPALIQAADLVGAPGLSVLWSVPFAFLVDLLRFRLDGPDSATPRARRLGILATVAVMLFLPLYGAWQLSRTHGVPGPRLAVIQPSEDHSLELTPRVVRVQQQLTLERVSPGQADMIVWPENAILTPYEKEPQYQEVVEFLAGTRQAPLLFGTQGFGKNGRRPTNLALLVEPDGSISGRYQKMYLFPFTERRLWPTLERRAPWLAAPLTRLTLLAWRDAPDGEQGKEVTPIVLDRPAGTWKFWTPICYESNYPELGREAARRGATFMVNLTSEGWMGWMASNYLMGANILRAVENRVGLVRAGNAGPSAFVSPEGRVEEYLKGLRTGRKRLDMGALTRQVQVGRGEKTVYNLIGGALDLFWPVFWAGAMVFFALGRRGFFTRGG